jgi:hypothetical protein
LETVSALLDEQEVINGQTISLAAMAGHHTFAVTAVDQAGNKAAAAMDFEVLIAATVDFKPETLNLASKGGDGSATVFIEFPEGYSVADIDISTVRLVADETAVPAQERPAEIADYDRDGAPDLMVKFDRAAVIGAIGNSVGQATLRVVGGLTDGRRFAGSDAVKTVAPPKKAR